MKTKISQNCDNALAYVKAVEFTFHQYDRKKYDEFLKIIIDLNLRKGGKRKIATRVKKLFEGNPDLILGFNTLLPKEYQITLPRRTGRNVKKVEENGVLPWDVLNIIAKRLDFDDLFNFAGVCKNWMAFHKIYWRNFLTSQEPLLLENSYDARYNFSFTLSSISDQKVYCLKMKKCFLFNSRYVASSSGYFIMEGPNNSFLLINPFTRINKIINKFEVKPDYTTNHALLAFGKCSEEFVLVVLCFRSLNVYQSRNCGWVTYSTTKNQGTVVDFVVFHNKIYVLTNMGNIGVLNLNFANIKFLKLKSTPNARIFGRLRWLVCCEEQLLVVDFSNSKTLPDVYKIDFSTMNYVKLETLGDIALFYVECKSCYALSNPNRWGYQSNSIYVTGFGNNQECIMYSWDDKNLKKCITLPAQASGRKRPYIHDWLFRHIKYEVDYSLVE
ncbi:uncharacterized protein LOC123915142 [Trifolium pratense]|uniref:uncharacterized protein LOC123915142 n=1 Tax=Trifolium pratense TaxID=57577 RepID=UPI001E69352B|nr:uncharacterized protein LOC123915142 [Trifolium pratense]